MMPYEKKLDAQLHNYISERHEMDCSVMWDWGVINSDF